ncbi:hypothetical protein [uncultured Brachyspira sp.]|uniref:hypothetical protein n=1 Tax=uncultured Brachyspira sp. TaxID=221953 RepID=UPI0027DE7A50|nr:hypothetical protein [uncultured Brachyspira sp.]
MKHTKNILKSLLIMVMALSLLAVSCKKDEGGSKPTDPTPTTISEQNIVETLQGFNTVATGAGSVDFKTGVTKIEASIALQVVKGNDTLTLNTFKTKMKEELGKKVANIPGVTVAVADTTPTSGAEKPETANNKPVVFELTITAKTGYVLDAGIKGYQTDKTVKLTLKFTPSGTDKWE